MATMATKIGTKTTYEAAKVIEPIYTGGDVSVDASGRILASCVDEDVLIIDTQTLESLTTIEGDGEPITSLAISPSASHLVICSRSLSMRVYALDLAEDETKIETTLLRTVKPHTTPVVSSAIDATGSLLATGAADGSIKLWDLKGGFVTHTFHGHGGVVSALCFYQSSQDSTGPREMQHQGKRKRGDDSEMIDVNGDQQHPILRLASGSEDGKIRIWNLHKRKSIAILDSHVSVVRALDFSIAQNALLSCSRDKTIIIWDARTWKSQKVIPVLETVEAAGFLGTGTRCYSGGEHGQLRVWDTVSAKEITSEQERGPESNAIVAVKHCRDSSFLMSIHVDQSFCIYNPHTLDVLKTTDQLDLLPISRRISGNHDEIIDMAYVGHDGSYLALATNTESVRIISINDKVDTKSEQNGSMHDDYTFGADVGLLQGHSEIVICLDVDWSGHWLVTGAKDNFARLWRLDPSNGVFTCFATFAGHAESIGAVALPRSSPPPSSASFKDPLNYPPAFLITGSQDRTVKRWETSSLEVSDESLDEHTVAKALFTRVAHDKDINAIDVSDSAPLFASASQDRTIKIWSLEDGSVAGILRGHKRGVWSVRFAPKGTPPLNVSGEGTSSSRGLILSGSGDRTVKIWSLSTYQCLLTFEGHTNSVLKVVWISPQTPPADQDAFEPSKRTHQTASIIASASSDTLIKLWSPYTTSSPASSDPLLTTLDAHTDRVWALATPSRAQESRNVFPLISGAADGRLNFWKDTTSETLALATQTASLRITQDQDLVNHIRTRNYREAITLSLTLNHPSRLLSLFADLLTNPVDSDSLSGNKVVDEVLAHLGDEHLWLLLLRLRDWNTNARTAPVAQKILHVLLKKYKSEKWLELGRKRGLRGGSMKDVLRALEAYTERHLRRTEDLVDESFVVEYTLRGMDEVLA